MEKLKRKEMEFLSRRASILEKAEKIFARKGFHNTSVAEIANASGFAIGSLYQFFEGKDDLYETMINQNWINCMRPECRVDAQGLLIGKLEAFIRTQFRLSKKTTTSGDCLQAGGRELQQERDNLQGKDAPPPPERYRFHFGSDQERVSRKNIPAGAFRDIGCALVGMIKRSSSGVYLSRKTHTPRTEGQVVLDIFLKGVGHEL